MTGLQTATYIVALVFMGVYTLVLLGVAIAALVIMKKVSRLQASVQEKIDLVRSLPYIGKRIFWAAKRR